VQMPLRIDVAVKALYIMHRRWRLCGSRQVSDSFKHLLMFPSAHAEPTHAGGLYGFACGGAMRVPGVMTTSPVDLKQISYTRSGSRRM
jgi:hypothetical protein